MTLPDETVETVAGTFTSGTQTHVPGGTVSWTFTSGDSDYTDASGTTTVVITAIAPTVSVTPYSGPYTGSAEGATGSATGVTLPDETVETVAGPSLPAPRPTCPAAR